MNINGAEIDAARNPGVLDTFTWDPQSAVSAVESAGKDLKILETAAIGSGGDPEKFRRILSESNTSTLRFLARSTKVSGATGHILLQTPDGQRVFLSASLGGQKPDMPVIGSVRTGWVKGYISPVNTETVRTFVTSIAPEFCPVFAGSAPRLGVGNRHTVAVWPGVFAAMRDLGGPGEIIQNSAYRELAPMDIIVAPPSGEAAYLPGHGSLNIGHTGTSIEGLWLAGVVSAIEHGFDIPYGCDLDHIPVKSLDEDGIGRAKRLIEAGRHYTFFTIDASPLFDFTQTELSSRYGDAIEATAVLFEHIVALKQGEPFDLEFSLDEGPALTEIEEQDFVLRGLRERGVQVQFVAPNVGFEKRLDYRRSDGLAGLEVRVRALSEHASGYGALLDFHSGSDKAPETYRTISRACGGRLKLKVSGKLQLILAEVLADVDPSFFEEWWLWTLETARHEAQRGSEVAGRFVSMLEERKASEGAEFRPSPKDLFFTDFSFAMVGAKDERGSFLHRDRFYSLSEEVLLEYRRRTVEYVKTLAGDLELYG